MALQQLRKGASGFLAKIFLFVLAASFLVWGIADVFRGFSRTTLATVGKSEISVDAFRQQYLDQLQSIGRRTGRAITPEQARAFGLDRQILGQMVTDATLDEQAHRLGLSVGDAQIAKAIQDNPSFRPQGATRFDPSYFDQLLRANGLTEARFVAAERKRVLRDQLVSSFGLGVTAPKTLEQAALRFEGEARDVSFVKVTPAVVGALPTPTDEQLRAYFDAHKIAFRAPEYRKVAVLALTPDALAQTVSVSDADLRAAYDRDPSRFGTPERREVSQIVFPSEAEAAAALARIKAGTPFADIARERNLSASDTDLGLVAKSAIIDPKIAETAFALPADGTSPPIEGRFGSVLVHVGKIEPGSQQPFEAVAGSLRSELALDAARRALLDKHDAIEDERASGSTLAETAKKLNLQLQSIAAVDRSGRDPSGAQIDLPARQDVVTGAFASQPGVETDTIQLPQNGGFVWYETEAITPSRERTFEEARDQVAARFVEDEQAKAVEARAKEVLAKAEAGTPLAEASGLPVETAIGLRRGRASADFPAAAVAKVFDLKQGGFGSASAATSPDVLVFQLTNIVPPSETSPEAAQLAQLSNQIENDLLVQYVAELQKQIGVAINDRALAQAVGGERVN